jgi:large conductance mechanosensitive channel
MSFTSEFKEFIAKGNVIDLAVGVVIGAAFGKIVNSFVEDIIMPPIGLVIGGVNFADLKIVLKEAGMDAAGKIIPAVAINYGNFIQVAISFMIVALAIFAFVVKPVNAMKKKEVAAVPPAVAPSAEIILLTEIRDSLRK